MTRSRYTTVLAASSGSVDISICGMEGLLR
jgi:hypothetical protein